MKQWWQVKTGSSEMVKNTEDRGGQFDKFGRIATK